jgi:hypothetical protein
MKERNGVRVGQRVRDLDGRPLGRVKELFDWGFGVEKGFPILFRKDHVFRYDEVRGTRDGALVVARTQKDLIDLSRGELPASWRIPAPAGFPRAATPAEARAVLAEIASRRLPPPAERIESARVDEGPPLGPAPAESLIWERPADELGAAEERRRAERRGEGAEARPPAH